MAFKQHRDPKHTAKIVKDCLENQKFQTIQWPTQSPDLNPIENLWSSLTKGLARYDNAPNNFKELWSPARTEWSNMPRALNEKLMDSMPKRSNSLKTFFFVNHKTLIY